MRWIAVRSGTPAPDLGMQLKSILSEVVGPLQNLPLASMMLGHRRRVPRGVQVYGSPVIVFMM